VQFRRYDRGQTNRHTHTHHRHRQTDTLITILSYDVGDTAAPVCVLIVLEVLVAVVQSI